MPSPFPGMDPYLECHWRDVHASLVIYIRDAIQDTLPPELRARVEERVVLETPEGLSGNPLYPDVRVIDAPPRQRGGVTTMIRSKTAEPILFEADMEPLTEGYIEIIDAESGNRVVTIIEVLSPSNKTPGADFHEYQRKQREIVQSDTNLVEIDLLRGGKARCGRAPHAHPSRNTHSLHGMCPPGHAARQGRGLSNSPCQRFANRKDPLATRRCRRASRFASTH